MAPMLALAGPGLAAAVLAGTALNPDLSPQPPAPVSKSHDIASTASRPASAPQAAWSPPVPGRIVSPFDRPQHTWLPGHRGIDLAAEVGEPVRAVADGVVAFAGMVAGRGVVSIQHGQLRSTYEPVEPAVIAGSIVEVGEALGRVGGAAHAGCRCLHLGARRGDEYVDPSWLLRSPSRLVSAGWNGAVSRPWPPSAANASE